MALMQYFDLHRSLHRHVVRTSSLVTDVTFLYLQLIMSGSACREQELVRGSPFFRQQGWTAHPAAPHLERRSVRERARRQGVGERGVLTKDRPRQKRRTNTKHARLIHGSNAEEGQHMPRTTQAWAIRTGSGFTAEAFISPPSYIRSVFYGPPGSIVNAQLQHNKMQCVSVPIGSAWERSRRHVPENVSFGIGIIAAAVQPESDIRSRG